MYRPDRASRAPTPSFSSTLLDKIYRSIDDPEHEIVELKSCSRQSKCGGVRSSSRIAQDPNINGILRSCLAEDMSDDRKPHGGRGRPASYEFDRKVKASDDDFFGSNSSSSDSSFGGFSSSDTESIYGSVKKQMPGSVLPPIPRHKPVRTTALPPARSAKLGKTEDKQRSALFRDHVRMTQSMIDDRRRYPAMEEENLHHDDGIIKSKSRALKIYANLKKVKQPMSPGGRLSSFINSLFTSGNTKKPKSFDDSNVERKSKSVQATTCSSASSFSRSCLNRNSPASRDISAKRTVRFCPVSVIVDEDLKPRGHKSLFVQDEPALRISAHTPSSRKAGRSPGKKPDNECNTRHNAAVEKSGGAEATPRDFHRDYHQKHNRSAPYNSYRTNGCIDVYDDDNDDDDDAASCSSSDLFELDHTAVLGNNSRYCEELPVYETTRVGRNLAIANGLMV